MPRKFLGMVMTPLDVQVEGLNGVMDLIATTGETAILKAVKAWFHLPDAIEHPAFAYYHIPGPEGSHPVSPETFRERIDEVCRQVAGQAQVMPLAHGYRPLGQWKRKVAIVRDSPADGMGMQRYCYLSDAKLRALGEIWGCG